MKKYYIYPAASLFVLLTVLLIYSFVSSNTFLSVILIIAGIIVCAGYSGLLRYRCFMKNRIIDPKINMKRNYDSLVLGTMSSIYKAKENELDMRNYSRNAFSDYLMLQRYYSFVKKGGKIKIYVQDSVHYDQTDSISRLDYQLLHHVTLIENKIDPSKIKYMIFNPLFGFVFLWHEMKSKIHTRKKSEITLAQYKKIKDFCSERGLDLLINESDER